MRNLAIARNWRQKTLRNCRCKKGTFLEKIGGYFKLSGENILLSILPAFHPFLTLPNKTLRSEKGTFFQFEAISSKARERYLFFGLETFPSKEQKGTFFAVGSDVLIIAEKEP